MYRHAAESIKETPSRNFITQIEKDKYNNYENIMRRKDDSYSKTEVENKIKELSDATYGTVEADYVSEYNTLDGYVKDLEILGNTIQNQDDLSDIKSVGTLQEDGTYNMSIVSCGKNLFDGELENGSISNTGSYLDSTNAVRTKNLIKVKPNTKYTITPPSGYITNIYVHEYNSNSEICCPEQILSNSNRSFMTSDNTKYIKFNSNNPGDNYDRPNLDGTILEEGTVATSYEPYKESRVDINLPCQLQKIGNVSDRLYYDNEEKAWCIEKNIEKKIFTGSDNEEWALKPFYVGNDKQYYGTPNHGYTFKEDGGISEFPVYSSGDLTRDHNGIAMTCSKLWGTIDYSVDIATLSEFKSWVKGKYIYVVPETPQKIILPLDTQIQLNSYANKTHIYTVSGEVEGTIKAILPKSLGASVQSLNDKTDVMIERIKNIETLKEGQNISYESDKGYVVCENTNNGQIDNIKIEGKTLVNKICNLSNISSENYIYSYNNDTKILSSPISGIDHRPWNSVPVLFNIENGKEYTFICEILNPDTTIQINTTTGINVNVTKTHGSSLGISVTKFTATGDVFKLKIYDTNKTQQVSIKNIMLLEGDYTQNPQSYFEGLMSVGGDVDEIEVISRKEDGNLFDISLWNDIVLNGNPIFTTDFSNNSITIHGNGKDIYTRTGATGAYTCPSNEKKYLIKVTPNTTYTLSLDLEGEGDLSSYIQQFDIDYNSIKVIRYDNKLTFTTDSRCYYVGIRVGIYENNTNIITFSNIMLEKNDTNSEYVPYKSHNKSLLYYNDLGELTPVTELHEWDSIEKHSDGKWYYHKRTHKIVLDGSENWYLNGNLINDVGYQYVARLDSLIPYENITTTIVKSDNFKDSSSHVEVDCLWLHKGRLVVIHSKLGLEELKSWLQSNNTTFVFKMLDESEEQVYECINLNLDTYDNETMVMCNSGAISPKLSFNVSSHIGNTVSILRERLKQIEEAFTKDKISQNTFQLNTMYSSDKLVFSVNIYACNITEYDEDLFTLITEVLLAGKDNYNLAKMEEIIDFYTMIGKLSFDMADVLFEMIENQINPPVIEIPEEEITILPEI